METNAKLKELTAELQRAGVQARFSPQHSSVNILQEVSDSEHCVYEILPWTADPQVPVLYFTLYTVRKEDGAIRPATAAEFKKSVLAQNSDEHVWISPTEHPVSGLPVLFLHPCRTHEWLASNHNSWWLWLQYFGTIVGLDLNVPPKPLEPS